VTVYLNAVETAAIPPLNISDQELRAAIAAGEVPLTDTDPRLEMWCLAGDIYPHPTEPRWVWNVHRPSVLPADVRDDIAADQRFVRAADRWAA
jgi:hypothetical protein